jgi:hypothetical protein
MESSRGRAESPPPQMAGRPAGLASALEPTSATEVLGSPGAAGYGRHAAPPSAYGPSDLHRLVPVPPIRSRGAERAPPGDALVNVVNHAVQAEVDAAADVGTDARSSGEVSTGAANFWARLRLLPRAA